MRRKKEKKMEKRKEVRRNLQAANKLNQVKKINIFLSFH